MPLLWIIFFLALPLHAQNTVIETAPVQPQPSPTYQSIIKGTIPANNPARNRTLTPTFGLPVARPFKPVWFGVDVGAYYGQFEKLPYADLFFTPYLRLWHVTIAYDLTMRFDFNSIFVTKIWKDPDALISRISMKFYWENPKEGAVFRNISANISTNNSITLGHGRFFYGYDAAPFAPTETLKTASFAMDASYVGLNAYLANIARPDLFGAEIYLRPLLAVKNPKIGYISGMRLYAAVAADMDSTQGPYTGYYDFRPSANPSSLTSIEAGAEIPLASKKDIFLLTGYGDFSLNSGAASGYGLAGGLIFTFINVLPLRVEYAQGFGAWSPHFADNFYTADRPGFSVGASSRISKAQQMPRDIGWYTISFGLENPKKSVFLNLEISGDSALTDLQFGITATLGQQLLKIFSLDLTLNVRNMLSRIRPFDSSDLALSITARYHMQPNMSWELLWRMRGKAGTSFTTSAGVPTPIASVDLYQFLGLGFSYRY